MEVAGQRALRRQAPDHEPVVGLHPGGDPLPTELDHPLQPALAHPLAQVRVSEEPHERLGERPRLAGRHQERLLAPLHDALVAVDVAADDGRPGCHRLEEDDPERFAAGGRRRVDIGGLEELDLVAVRDTAQELDVGQAARHHVAACLALLWPGADDEEPAVAAALAQDPVRLEKRKQPLARLESADEQDVRAAILPASHRDRVGETAKVHAVRDHLVVAGQVAVGEVPGGGADRDPAVEVPGDRPQHLPAQLVAGRITRIGVERGDVHAPGLAQREEREEGHEGLVEVQEVELLTVQHGLDLAPVAGRHGQRPHRPVRRHGETLPDPDDIAFGAALEAVAGGQDPDVVATCPERLVEVPDVVVHAAGERVDVRRDEPDLHDASSRGRPTPPVSFGRGGRKRPPG